MMETIIVKDQTNTSSPSQEPSHVNAWLMVQESASKERLSSMRSPELHARIDCDSCPSDEKELSLLSSFCALYDRRIVEGMFFISTEFRTRTIEQADLWIRERKLRTFTLEEDILDWDASIEKPPYRPSGTIRAKLVYKGRSKPIFVEDPWAE